MATDAVRISKTRGRVPAVALEIAALFESLAKALFDPYRPELHYMRGPGPKWRAKHAAARVILRPAAAPVLVPVRIKR
jgi:hypothetical protein